MAGRKRKEKGGGKEKKTKLLENDASKCRKLTELFDRGGGASAAAASSSRSPTVDVELASDSNYEHDADHDVVGETARESSPHACRHGYLPEEEGEEEVLVYPPSSTMANQELTERKVLLLYTGGTIGMSYKDNGILEPVKKEVLEKWVLGHCKMYEEWPSKTNEQPGKLKTSPGWFQLHQKMVDDYCTNFRVLCKIDTLDEPIDSSSMAPEQWFEIGKRIEKVLKDFDGFVILHGTDTMAYTASALSFILRDTKKPVILTGAQRTIFHPRSDAVSNLLGAMLIASCFSSNKLLQQVMVYYDNKLFQGNRVGKLDCDSFAAFDSPNIEPLAKLKAVIKDGVLPVRECKCMAERKLEEIKVRARLCENIPDVRLLKFFPGITAKHVSSVLNGADGLVLESFGSGNIPDDRALISILTEANEKGIIIMNCTQVYKGTVQPIYNTDSPLWSVTVSGYDITPEAALTKMIWVLKMIPDKETRKKVLSASICGESSAPEAEMISRITAFVIVLFAHALSIIPQYGDTSKAVIPNMFISH